MGKPQVNFLERTISTISPSWAASRAANRVRLNLITRSYDAADQGRSREGWQTFSETSGNSETRFVIRVLRERSRDLVRNNPYAKKAIQVLTTNTIGTGIKPSIPKGAVTKAEEKRILSAFSDWAETTAIDYNGKANIYGIQMQAYRAMCESGDAFLRIYRDISQKIPFKVQLLEADFCDDQRDGYAVGDGGYIVQGVEFDKNHKIVAYWMFEKHPADLQPIVASLMSKRIPAEEIIHLYEQLRPGQVRGVPQGVAAFSNLRDLGDYQTAQLMRQKIASCYTVFVRKNDKQFQENYDLYNKAPGGAQLDPLSEKLSPGQIDYLNPGEDITFAEPPGTVGYDEYTKTIIRGIAIAFGITYESMSGDLSNVNFSSGRMGWLEMHRQITQSQELVAIPGLCNPLWSLFMTGAIMRGLTSKSIIANWTPPRRDMIDPAKEIKGFEAQIRAGLISRSEALRQFGYDPENTFNEIVEERKEADAAGVWFSSDVMWDAARVNFGPEMALKLKKSGPPQAPQKPASGAKKAKVAKV